MAKLEHLAPRAVLTLEGEAEYEIERIGRGRYTAAWRSVQRPGRVFLFVKDPDSSKELLCHCQGPHIPELSRQGTLGDDVSIYQTRYYHPLKASIKTAWTQYRTLEKHLGKARQETQPDFTRNYERDWCKMAQLFSDSVQADESLPESLRDAVDRLVTWVQTYDYALEIIPRNLAVDDHDTLILLDPCFSWRDIQAKLDSARAKNRFYAGAR